MGFLDRLRGRDTAENQPSQPTSDPVTSAHGADVEPDPSPTNKIVSAMLFSGDDTLEVVGESYRQDALWSIVGGQRRADVRHNLIAVLVPDPSNEHDPNAIGVHVNGLLVGYLSREDAVEYGPGVRSLMAEHNEYVALEGVALSGSGPTLGVFLDHDPADFGLSATQSPSPTERTGSARPPVFSGNMRTGFSEAWLADADDDDYDLSWFDNLPDADRAAISMLRELLDTDPDPIDRHFQFNELEVRLYRCRELYDEALDEYDEACRHHDAEMEDICAQFQAKWAKVPLLDTYRQMAVRQQKAKNWDLVLWWSERGLSLYGDNAARADAVEDLMKRRNRAWAKLEAPAAKPATKAVASFTAPIATERVSDGPPEVTPVGEIEILVCEQCANSFERLRVRGRKPKLCPTCRTA